MRSVSRLAAFIVFALVVLVALYGDAFFRGLKLSQSDILFGYAPWSAHAPAGFTRPGNDLLGDIPQVFYPFFQETAKSLRAGALPLWTTGIFAGHPFLASYQTATFSPFTLPALVLPAADALLIAAIAKLLTGALGMWLLLRRYGLSPAAVWFGAAAYLLNPFSVCWAEHPVSNVSAWVPWLLWSVDRLLASHAARDVGLLALAMAVVILAGHPETSYKVLLFGGAYVIVSVLVTSIPTLPGWDGARVGRVRTATVTLVTTFGPAAVLGFVLAAIQLVPFAEYLLQSYVWEMRRGFDANAYPAPFQTSVSAIVPNFLGNPSKGLYLPMQNAYGVVSNFCEQMIYPGIAAWVLAALGLVAFRGSWRVRFFAASGVVGACLMYGVPGFAHLLMLVPGASVVVLSRFGLVTIVSAIVLAAFGVDALTRCDRETRAAAWPAAATVVLMFVALIPCLVWARGFLEANDLWRSTLAWSAAAIVMAGLVAALVMLRVRDRIPAGVFAALVVALVTVDLFAIGWRFHPMIPPDQVFPSTPAIDLVRADRGLFRVAGVGDSLLPNAALNYGLQDLRGYDGMQPTVHGEVVGISHKGGAYRVIRETETFTVLDLMNVKYLFARSTQRLPAPHFTPVLEEAGATLYRNEGAFPRAFLVGRVRITTPPESLRLIRAGAIDLRREAVLYAPLPEGQTIDAAEPGAEGVARVTRYEPTYVEIETEAAGRRLLVLSDLDYPGWRATIDGAPASILRADRGLRSVVLPTGRHRVSFTFEPQSVRIGAWLTLAALAVLAALSLARPRNSFSRGPGRRDSV